MKGLNYLAFVGNGLNTLNISASQIDTSLLADGPVPLASTFDNGFALSASQFVMPQKLMVYGRGSKVFGQFGDSWEYAGGVKPFVSRCRSPKRPPQNDRDRPTVHIVDDDASFLAATSRDEAGLFGPSFPTFP